MNAHYKECHNTHSTKMCVSRLQRCVQLGVVLHDNLTLTGTHGLEREHDTGVSQLSWTADRRGRWKKTNFCERLQRQGCVTESWI